MRFLDTGRRLEYAHPYKAVRRTPQPIGGMTMACTIRPWTLADAPSLAAMLNNKAIQTNLRDGIPYPYTADDAEQYLQSLFHSPEDAVFAFAIDDGGTLVGSIGIFRQENIHRRTAELGYYVAQPYWGRGIGTSAVRQACRYVFSHTDIVRIFAEPFAYNLASCRLLEKVGFHLEGTLRQNAEKNGRILDMQLYALLKDDTLQV